MSKVVYCANCGTRLSILRKALPTYGRIIDIVEYHECLDEPAEFDLTPIQVPIFRKVDDKNKFADKVGTIPNAINEGLSDRRFEVEPKPKSINQVKSTAPQSILGMLDSMTNSAPEHEITELDNEDEE